jgi:hypothetical protein
MRSTFARSAHGGQMLARVAPHGTITGTVSPVTVSVRRSCTGRKHPPTDSAILRIESRANGRAARSVRVWRPVINGRLLPLRRRAEGELGAAASPDRPGKPKLGKGV